jgi:double zinc ribbon protein
MIGLELVGSLLLAAAVLWLVLGPASGGSEPEPEFEEPLPLEETRRGQALVALNEIEFDHATGKLSDDDFALLSRKHGRQALALLGTPVSDQAEALVSQFLEIAPGRPACPDCGPRPESDAAYCSGCGRSLKAVQCPGCSAPLQAGAKFCAECGRPAA